MDRTYVQSDAQLAQSPIADGLARVELAQEPHQSLCNLLVQHTYTGYPKTISDDAHHMIRCQETELT